MASGSEFQQKVYAEQVRKAYESLPSNLMVNLVNSCVLVYVQWQVIAHSTLMAWFGSLTLVSLIRLGFSGYENISSSASAEKWGRLYIAGLFISGVIWGSAGIFLFPAHDAAHQLIVAFVLGGMVAGATVASAALPHAFYFYCLPAITPILFKYYQAGGKNGHAMCLMILVFVVFSIAMYRRIHKMIFDLIGARIENEQESAARKEAEKKAGEHQDFLEAVLLNINDGIVACDAQGNPTLFNRAAQKLLASPMRKLTPEKWAEHFNLYAEDGRTLLRKDHIPLYRALQGENVQKQEICIIRKGGEKKIVLASGQPLIGSNEKKIGAVISMHDITGEKNAKIALQKAYGELEKKVAERTEELVNVNRDLRREIEERRKAEKENLELIRQLQEAIREVKTLSGFLPICASCKKIRDDSGYWSQIEEYLQEHSDARFSHGLCPECMQKQYPDEYKRIRTRKNK